MIRTSRKPKCSKPWDNGKVWVGGGSIMSDYLHACLGLDWSVKWSPYHDTFMGSHRFVSSCDMKEVIFPGSGMLKKKLTLVKCKTISLSLPKEILAKGSCLLGILKSHAQVTHGRLDGLIFPALGSCCLAPEIPGGDKIKIGPHLLTRTG